MTEENQGQLPQQEELGQKSVEAVNKEKGPHDSSYSPIKSTAASLLFAATVCALLSGLGFFWGGGRAFAQLLWPAFVAVIGFLILRTGKVARFRSLFFVVLAWAFVLHFKHGSVGLRGGPFAGRQPAEAPYCHIAMAASFLNYAYFQFLALKSGSWRMWGPLTLGALWLALTLVLGQAWCSWACFYGGLDDGFSRLLSKPKLRWWRLPGRLREFPAALLLFMMLVSLYAMMPVFCLWVCPLKMTTSFLDPYAAVRKAQLILFVLSGSLGLILIPALTKKRVFCGLICPFGPWQAFWGKVSPFRVTIAPEACTQCQLCLKACPIFAIEGEGLKSHEIGPYCNRCGECLDVCATGAIRYTVLDMNLRPLKGTGVLGELWDARVIFLFSALVMGGAVGGIFVPDLLARFWP